MSTNSGSSKRRAVLFDIDGTLVDSNYLHVSAWHRALSEAGHPVDAWRVHRAIGMDSAKLLESLVGADADAIGDRAKTLNSTYYAQTLHQLRPFAGVRELFVRLRRRGIVIVLATSAPEDELVHLRKVLDSEDLIDAFTSSDDVGTAKPEPDIIRVALEKAGVTAENAVMVGDAVWDMEAARRAGVGCIGFLSGGTGAEELKRAGAAEIYEGPADLLERLETSALAELWRA